MDICLRRWSWSLLVVLCSLGWSAEPPAPRVDSRLGVPDRATIEWPDGTPPGQPLIDLGRQLFFDRRLSRNQTQSCATCHNPALGFGDGLALGVGVHGNRLTRHTPHLYNLAWNSVFFWDGRASSLEEQALNPIQAPGEMAMDLPTLLTRLNAEAVDRTHFTAVFGDPEINAERLAAALAAFQRTIIADNSAFDRYVRGDDLALAPAARRGLELFTGKANCIACHSGPNFTDQSFHNLGLRGSDPGRAAIVPGIASHGAFKTPGLRNVAHTGPYFHDGSVPTLTAVVEFYNRGGDVPTPDPLMRKLGLSAEEIADLTEFLGALSEPATP